MYKIFINDKPFIIADSVFIDNSFPTHSFEEDLFDTKIFEALEKNFKGIVFNCNDVEKAFQKFSKHFKLIEAAGGLVFNNKNELLFIERLGVWDLPKGKIDSGETPAITAIREVEEECGINGLTIENFICESYHLYFFKEKNVLKRTYWYKMKSTFIGELVPQIEENITKVEWMNFSKSQINSLKTYESIKVVLIKYFG
jgi:8-oxo-dGTP pyrophosphatase MutT (NUDIX family)